MLLEATGHRTRAAASVAEALRIARGEDPDAILVDLTLPDGDGLEIVRALGAEGRLPARTFAVTGHDDPATSARCLAAGCRAVLVKPVKAAVLLAAIDG